MVNEYCFQHTNDILQGKNPINDLIKTGLIYSWDFEGKTCSDIPTMMLEYQSQQSSQKLWCELIKDKPCELGESLID
jgi:hypothetical protein